MVLWGVQEMPPRNREPKPAKRRTCLLIIASTGWGTGRVHLGKVHSFIR